MKNLLKKLFLGTAFVLAVAFLANSNTIEPAEAYYGDWKSQTTACVYAKLTISWEGEVTITEPTEGTMRRCVDGSGWCFWNGSCG